MQMKNKINGFIVLRKPELNYHITNAGCYFPFPPPCVSGIYYSGAERMGWFDFDQEYFEKVLPERYLSSYRDISGSTKYNTSCQFSMNFYESIAILEYTNKYPHFPLNELVVFRSERVITERFVFTEKEIEWIGTDLISHSQGSLLLQGYFTKPEAFRIVQDCINENGLLISDCEVVDRYFKVYMEKTEEYNLEPFEDDHEYMDKMEIGRVIL